MVAVLLVVPLLLAGCSPLQHPAHPARYDPDEYGSSPQGWARVAESPLSARRAAIAVWLGREYLVVGGHRCRARRCTGPALRDGALYDPATDTWTAIAPAPVPVSQDRQAVVGRDLYIATPDAGRPQHEHLLRYDVSDDAWTRLASPPNGPGTFSVDGSGTLTAVAERSDGSGPADVSFSAETGRWRPLLPADPIGASSHRRLFWVDGDLVLFAQLPERDGAPARVQTTTIWSSRGWSPPEDVPVAGGAPVLISSVNGVVLFPDGDRTRADDDVPGGGVWSGTDLQPLPSTPPSAVDRTGITQALVVGDGVVVRGALIDTGSNTSSPLPPLPGRARTKPAAATDGTDLFVWGGVDRDGVDLATGYVLYL